MTADVFGSFGGDGFFLDLGSVDGCIYYKLLNCTLLNR